MIPRNCLLIETKRPNNQFQPIVLVSLRSARPAADLPP
jgi:hypothetical protein